MFARPKEVLRFRALGKLNKLFGVYIDEANKGDGKAKFGCGSMLVNLN